MKVAYLHTGKDEHIVTKFMQYLNSHYATKDQMEQEIAKYALDFARDNSIFVDVDRDIVIFASERYLLDQVVMI